MSPDDYVHTPVLLEEVLQGLELREDGIYVDCTFGRGGHSRAILERLGQNGTLYVFDRDPEAIAVAQQMAVKDGRLQCFNHPFSRISSVLESAGLTGRVDGILFDLGVSSPQLDDPDRGFSFSQEGTLDMRMDPASGISAAEWLNEASLDDIRHVLKFYGEEKFARRIATAIVAARAENPLTNTLELARIVTEAIPVREKKKHPATRTFQAIRIFLNNELDEISAALIHAYDLLKVHGRLVVISFHSLEDRIVKRFMREHSRNDPYPSDLPVTADMIKPDLKIRGRAIRASAGEVAINNRARSATLRVAEKL